jgi:hypothetical protein
MCRIFLWSNSYPKFIELNPKKAETDLELARLYKTIAVSRTAQNGWICLRTVAKNWCAREKVKKWKTGVEKNDVFGRLDQWG